MAPGPSTALMIALRARAPRRSASGSMHRHIEEKVMEVKLTSVYTTRSCLASISCDASMLVSSPNSAFCNREGGGGGMPAGSLGRAQEAGTGCVVGARALRRLGQATPGGA